MRLVPGVAARVGDRQQPVVLVVDLVQRAAVGAAQAQQVAARVVGEFGAQAFGVGDRHGAADRVVLEHGDPVQRIDLAQRQAVLVELHQRHVAQRVGHLGLAQQGVVGETVVVQAAVAPGVHHPPLRVVGVVERQADAVGMPDHAVLAVRERARHAQRVLGGDQVAFHIAIGHQRMGQAGGRIVQLQAVDAAVPRLHLDEAALQPAHAAFDDAHQVAVAALEAPMVAAGVLDLRDRQGLRARQHADTGRRRIGEAVAQVGLGPHQQVGALAQQPRAVDELDDRDAVGVRQLREHGHAVAVVEQHHAVGVDLQADVGRRLPAVAAGAGLLAAPGTVAARPGQRQPPGDREVLVLHRHAAVADVHRLGAQHLALEEAGIHVLEHTLPQALERLRRPRAQRGAAQRAQRGEAGMQPQRHPRHGQWPADLHVARDGHIDAGRQQQRTQRLLGLLEPERRDQPGEIAVQHRHRQPRERVAVGRHRLAAHEDLFAIELRPHRQAQLRRSR